MYMRIYHTVLDCLTPCSHIIIKFFLSGGIENEERVVTLGDCLTYFTGAQQIPNTGFHKSCTLSFNSSNTYPSASTCALVHTCTSQYHESYPMLYGFVSMVVLDLTDSLDLNDSFSNFYCEMHIIVVLYFKITIISKQNIKLGKHCEISKSMPV